MTEESTMSESEGAAAEMPRYKCHKTVHALKIETVDRVIGGVRLNFADKGYAPIKPDSSIISRYMPVPGDYYVVYEDGYKSISPAKAFEDGYTRIE